MAPLHVAGRAQYDVNIQIMVGVASSGLLNGKGMAASCR